MKTLIRTNQSGFALPAALLLLLIISGIAVGMIHLVQNEARVSGSDLDQASAHYAAEAGMEKMMADLSALYVARQAPSVSEIRALETLIPELQYIEFPEYRFNIPTQPDGTPESEFRAIPSGDHAGLSAQVIALELSVTGKGPAGTEVRMNRQVQVALIPVFQFGVFSDLDLAFHAGQRFDFGGRTHTNGNLFLAASSSGSLWFQAKVSAAGEIIRAEMINGKGTLAAGRTGPILIPTLPNGCAALRENSTCRRLSVNEGSRTGGPQSAENVNWEAISLETYHSMLTSGRTGGHSLQLPFVKDGDDEIEIIKRPPDGENPASLLGRSRLYNQAQIRVLLDDDPANLPGGVGIELATGEFESSGLAFAQSAGQPLLGGYLLVQARRAGGGYEDVTSEWLNLGFSYESPNAILKLQRIRDANGNGVPDYPDNPTTRLNGNRYMGINMYDAREGERRDLVRSYWDRSCALGGVMNVIDLDVANLKTWLQFGLTGPQVESTSQNGYIFYFSDRRGMTQPQWGNYGFEDTINPNSSSGQSNGILDPPEDVNADGVLQTYGADTIGNGFGAPNGDPTWRMSNCASARIARVTGPRHAIRLMNGRAGNLPSRADGTGGFTLASENPVYIWGDYNANGSFSNGDGHVPASIISDATTLLSNRWRDRYSLRHPAYPLNSTQRYANETWYRVAVATGKNIAFPNAPPLTIDQHYGLDGGTHNFLRLLERWRNVPTHYKGSLVSFFYARQATGIFKCCESTYVFAIRDYSFDNDFMDPAKLPPGTPRFQDLVNVGYQQKFDPAHVEP